MKKTYIILITLALLAGCASFEEAYYLDREFGQASRETWNKQILNPEAQTTKKVPTDIAGINTERAMDTHNKSFGDIPEKTEVYQFTIGDDSK